MFGSVEDRKIPRRPAAVFIVSGSAVSCHVARPKLRKAKELTAHNDRRM